MMRPSWQLAGLAGGLALLVSGCQEYGNYSVEQGGAEGVASSRAAVEACTPSGAHGKHAQFACTTCHSCGGGLSFDPSGAAVGTNQPFPTFDATAKTCSNVSCHGLPAGTYTYQQWDWGCECLVPVSIPYGGTSAVPYWYATGGATCGACHNAPANNYTWHSGRHGYQYQYSITNACQLCHPTATGFTNTSGVVTSGTIVQPTLHANGTVEVNPQWAGTCLGCH